jgi:hypothetical protein
MDINPLPVLGVLNRRPEGPCINTQVDLEKVEESLLNFLDSSVPLPSPGSKLSRLTLSGSTRGAKNFGTSNPQES